MEVFAGEDGVEGVGELGVPVADQEAKRADLLAQLHHQVTSGLGSPGRGRMRGHTENMDSASPHFHHKQDVESAQRDGVQGEEIGGQQPSVVLQNGFTGSDLGFIDGQLALRYSLMWPGYGVVACDPGVGVGEWSW